MSRTPSSADLAAFRYAIHEAGPDHDPTLCPMDGPRTRTGWPTGGAWPHELRDGTPGHPSDPQPFPIGSTGYVAAWWTERQHGCPTWLREEPECPACRQPNAPDGPGCRCYGD